MSEHPLVVLFTAATGAVLSVEYTNTVNLGAILLGVLLSLAGLAVLAYGARWKSAFTVASTQAEELRKALLDERESRRGAEERSRDLLEIITGLKTENERLAQLPNLERVLKLMHETAASQDKIAQQRLERGMEQIEKMFSAEMRTHDADAGRRHDALVEVLGSVEAHMAGVAAGVERLVRATVK
jgi:hypothetical protein